MNFTVTDPPPEHKPKAFGLSDLLPPAMLKDLRQSLRSPLYLLLMAISVTLLYLLEQPRGGNAPHLLIYNWSTLLIYITLILIFFVPAHAARSISGDIRERGSNFLQLCPLSAGRIIWGQFLSGAAQLALLVLAMSPLIHQYQLAASPRFSWMVDCGLCSLPAYAFCGLTVLLIYILALFALAMLMMLAGMPLYLRLMAQLAVGSIAIAIQSSSAQFFNRSFVDPELAQSLLRMGGMLAILLLMGTLCALHLAKRHYAAFVEVRSGWLRLLAGLFLLAPLAYGKLVKPDMELLSWVELTQVSLLAARWWVWMDELMPRDTPPRKKLKIFAFNRCNSGANLSCMVFLTALAILLPYLAMKVGIIPPMADELMQQALRYNAMLGLSCFSTSCFLFLLVQLLMKPTSRARLAGFCLLTLVIYILSLQLYFFVLDDLGQHTWLYLPFINMMELRPTMVYSNHLFIQAGIVALSCYVLCCLVLYCRQGKQA